MHSLNKKDQPAVITLEMNIHSAVLAIGTMLNQHRFELHNEKALQADIERLFIEKTVPYQREVTLSKESIIDFMVDGVGIEVKLSGTTKNIYRQCERYCQFDEVKAFMLVTNKAMRLPYLNNKFTYVVNLGQAWL